MVQLQSDQRPKLLQYLRSLAPYSIVDKGIALSAEGRVSECSRVGPSISAVIKANDEETYSVSLEILSAHRVRAQCRCSSNQEMEEQWCLHAVAGLWRASELGFFEPHSGFSGPESGIRVNTSSPEDIASVLEKIRELAPPSNEQEEIHPEVSVELFFEGDRLGLQVWFDEKRQEPQLFADSGDQSSRALDNILIQVLDEAGSWDENQQRWYVSSSHHLEIIFGILEEFPNIREGVSQQPVQLSRKKIDARLEITWRDLGAQLLLYWVLPDKSEVLKQNDLIGTGPYWINLENTVYRVHPRAARLASIFPHSASVSFPNSQIGPVIEVLQELPEDSSFVTVSNPELQPKTRIRVPKPELEIWQKDSSTAHFSSQESLQLFASLNFRYPSPKKDARIVSLPDREKERMYRTHLEQLGFSYIQEKKRFVLEGDKALDLVERGEKAFPEPWSVNGLREIQQQTKIAGLELNIAITKASGDVPSKDTNWFDCHISLTQNNANVPLSTLFKNMRAAGDRWIRLDNGAFAKVPGGGLGKLKTSLGLVDSNFRLSNTIKAQVSVPQALGLSQLEDDNLHLRSSNELSAIARKLSSFERIEAIRQPRGFSGKLRSYQREGLSWLYFLHQFQLGGVLADEMGLGKTIQALALLQYLSEGRSEKRRLKGPSLIIAPTSVITNWSYEARKFTPKLKTLLLHGPKRKSQFQNIPKHDIVISSYALLRVDRYELARFEFDYVILDEAHYIKNPVAATTKAAKSLKADHRLALTGTPTENRPQELWSLFDFLMPGYLGSNDFFRQQVERPIVDGDDTGTRMADYVRRKTRPFILRRLKDQVEKDLPRKSESVLHVPMEPSQASLYVQILEEVRPQIFDAVEKKGVRGASISILAALLRLRQVCNHPNSIAGLESVEGYESGKFNLLKELLREALDSGRKILLFSQFREMLKIIRRHVEKEEINHLYLDGTTKDRQSLVDEFNANGEIPLFLMSLKAGGTGLNLTGADTVIIYDPWWNPAVESQAVDRAHRIGQNKPVSVYRLTTEDSIEQKIMNLKEKKEKIIESIISEESGSPLDLSATELESLFSLPAVDEE